jgi:hypothetical protein
LFKKVSKTAKKEEKYFFLATMPQRYALGRAEDATHPDSMRAFIATFIFVFAGEGSVLALGNYLQLFYLFTWKLTWVVRCVWVGGNLGKE